jgi:heptosyltransferase-2
MRTLLIKLGAIGDVIMTIPAAHQLHLQGHQIDWLCGQSVLPILKFYPWINAIPVDDVAVFQGTASAKLRVLAALWRRFAFQRYDLVATLHYDERYKLLTLPVRTARRIQLSDTDRAYRLLPGRHHTDEFARILLNRPDTLTPLPLAPVLPPFLTSNEPAATRSILIAPGGARNLKADDRLRRWPVELYVELVRLLLAESLEVTLIGGPTDAWVEPFFAGLPVANQIGKLKLPDTVGLMDHSAVVITHDTGPLHLAGITRASIVTIFGPTDPRGRLPQRPGTVALWGGEGFACRPCYDAHTFADCPANDCMAQVTPEMVLAEAMTLLAARAAGELPPPRVISGRELPRDHLFHGLNSVEQGLN